ncbi:MAG: nirD [Frankiales bacterium]|nr:nirD [Frankiales bacterium]
MTAELLALPAWTTVCWLNQLQVGRGVAALVDGDQVALVRTPDGWLHAVGNRDPRSGAMVMSRGIVGSRGDRPTLAGPLYKQVFDLETGECLDDPSQRLPVHEVAVVGGLVRVRLARD